MRGLVIKPHRLSNPGTIGEYAEGLGAKLVHHVAGEDPAIPRLNGFDFVLAMGSPHSVYGEEVGTWIGTLIQRIREAVDRGMPFLGVCFGAQAFAEALGGKVWKAEQAELGWGTVDVVAPGPVVEGPWMMWHSDTFSLPDGATLLAETASGPQAFTYGPSLLVQFHPEVSPELLRDWCDIDDSDFARFGVSLEEVARETERRKDEGRERARRLLDWVLAGLDGA